MGRKGGAYLGGPCSIEITVADSIIITGEVISIIVVVIAVIIVV